MLGLRLVGFRFMSSMANVKIKEQKVKVGGFDLNFALSRVEGKEKCEKTLLMLPGALGSALTDFKPQLENLPKLMPNHQIIAWDPTGYGKSIPPKRKFSLDFLEHDADYAKELMEVLNISSYDILGWSDGGITAMILAGKYPQKVNKLAFFGSNAFVVEDEIKIYEKIRDVSQWSAKMREPLEKLYGAEYFEETWEKWTDTFGEIYKERRGDLCKKFLKEIKGEVLILHGEKDPMIDKIHIPYLMEKLPQAKLITWPEGKHNIHLRYAEEFNKKVANFFNGKSKV